MVAGTILSAGSVAASELLDELVGGAISDAFPSMRNTTAAQDAVEDPAVAMAGVTGGSGLAIAMRELMKRIKDAPDGSNFDNAAIAIAKASGVEDRTNELIKLGRQASSSKEAFKILDETISTNLDPRNFSKVGANPSSARGKDIKSMQEFLLKEADRELVTAKRAASRKSNKFSKMANRLALDAERSADLPPLSTSIGGDVATRFAESGASTASGGPVAVGGGARGSVIGSAAKRARGAVDIVDASFSDINNLQGLIDNPAEMKRLGLSPKDFTADMMNEFTDASNFKKAKSAAKEAADVVTKEAGDGIFSNLKKFGKRGVIAGGAIAAIMMYLNRGKDKGGDTAKPKSERDIEIDAFINRMSEINNAKQVDNISKREELDVETFADRKDRINKKMEMINRIRSEDK